MVGLAVARALAVAGREVIVLEAADTIGSETSSRNSGVIHAGIYYPQGSLKAELCVAGKQALYDYCVSHGIEHRRIGKVLVATDQDQLEVLERYQRLAAANGVSDLERLSVADVRALEPAVECAGGLWSPSTGIIDVHDYMLALLGDAERAGAVVAFHSLVSRVERSAEGLVTVVQALVQDSHDAGSTRPDGGLDHPDAGDLQVENTHRLGCRVLVNAAGLHAQTLAGGVEGLAGEHVPTAHYAKGNYFYLSGPSPFRHLVYPMPTRGSLGVHVSFDLGGRCRFGPDIHWVDVLDYAVEADRVAAFYEAIRRYWPGLPDGSLAPDYTGIRPKLTREGEPAADFVIQTEEQHGVRGLINLFGIESPGLTSSLAIGERVAELLRC